MASPVLPLTWHPRDFIFVFVLTPASKGLSAERQHPELRGISGAMKLMKMIWGGGQEGVGAPSETTSQRWSSK